MKIMICASMWQYYVAKVHSLLEKVLPLLKKTAIDPDTIEQLIEKNLALGLGEAPHLETISNGISNKGSIGIVYALEWICKLREILNNVKYYNGTSVIGSADLCSLNKSHNDIHQDINVIQSFISQLDALLAEKITYPMISKLDLILVTNDDGYGSTGIRILTDIATTIARRVVVVAPTHNRSGRSHSIGINESLEVLEMEKDRFRLTGSTVDCVTWALVNLLGEEQHIDAVLSGINCGQNYGDDMRYSSTFAGAVEAYIHTLAIGRIDVCMAVNQKVTLEDKENFGCSRRYGLEIVSRVIEGIHGSTSDRVGRLFNVNFPCADRSVEFEIVRHDEKINNRSYIILDKDLFALSDGQCTGGMYGADSKVGDSYGQEHMGLLAGNITIARLDLLRPVEHASLKFKCDSLIADTELLGQLDTILITNDEGPGPGLSIAISIARKLAKRVIAVVPEGNNSGSSQALTLCKIKVRKVSQDYYCVSGTPTDCVIMALSAIAPNTKIDLLMCGIGHSNNLEHRILYSGVFGAVMEGLTWRVTGMLGAAIALYMPRHEYVQCIEKLYRTCADVTSKVMELGNSFEEQTGRKVCFNVNFPQEILPSSKMVICDSPLKIISLPTMKQVGVSGDARYFEYAEDTSLNQEDNPSSEMTNLKAGNIVIRAYEFNYNLSRSSCSL